MMCLCVQQLDRFFRILHVQQLNLQSQARIWAWILTVLSALASLYFTMTCLWLAFTAACLQLAFTTFSLRLAGFHSRLACVSFESSLIVVSFHSGLLTVSFYLLVRAILYIFIIMYTFWLLDRVSCPAATHIGTTIKLSFDCKLSSAGEKPCSIFKDQDKTLIPKGLWHRWARPL